MTDAATKNGPFVVPGVFDVADPKVGHVMMFQLHPEHERRLRGEGAMLKSRLGRLIRCFGGRVTGDDALLHTLNHLGAFDIVGLVAVTVVMADRRATAVTAPGTYMYDPVRRAALLGLVAQARDRGVRCVLVFKRCLVWRARRVEALIPQARTAASRRAPLGRAAGHVSAGALGFPVDGSLTSPAVSDQKPDACQDGRAGSPG